MDGLGAGNIITMEPIDAPIGPIRCPLAYFDVVDDDDGGSSAAADGDDCDPIPFFAGLLADDDSFFAVEGEPNVNTSSVYMVSVRAVRGAGSLGWPPPWNAPVYGVYENTYCCLSSLLGYLRGFGGPLCHYPFRVVTVSVCSLRSLSNDPGSPNSPSVTFGKVAEALWSSFESAALVAPPGPPASPASGTSTSGGTCTTASPSCGSESPRSPSSSGSTASGVRRLRKTPEVLCHVPNDGFTDCVYAAFVGPGTTCPGGGACDDPMACRDMYALDVSGDGPGLMYDVGRGRRLWCSSVYPDELHGYPLSYFRFPTVMGAKGCGVGGVYCMPCNEVMTSGEWL